MRTMNKKGLGLGDLSGIAITLVVAAIVIALGLSILTETDAEFVENTAEDNATEAAVEGLGTVADKLPMIGLVIGAVLVIGIVVSAFAGKRR